MASQQPRLRLIQGGRERRIYHGQLEVVVAPAGPAPFELDAVVLEDDTHRVLAAPPELAPVSEALDDLVRAMHEFSPGLPGSVVPRSGRPLALHAIIHDLDLAPSWQERWVEQALRSVLVAVRERRIRSLGVPLLGTVHGKMAPARSIELLLRVLREVDSGPLARLWVLAPRALLDPVAAQFARDDWQQPMPS
ncbi:MAG: hypothetical protein PVI15_00190 [Chromatiales bacterium]|jgi:hypothetical protein